MSQQLTPIDGGILEVQTSVSSTPIKVVSTPYIEVKGLNPRLTEWNPEGRPIYRRLPATGETYQIDFFNIINPPNTAVSAELQEVGYVYVPWGEGINGPSSSQVVEGDSPETILIKAGKLVWAHGTLPTLPTIINLEQLEVNSGAYDIAYELVYDDEPLQKLYSVENYSLSGLPMTVSGSTDGVVGWRYPAVNAFLSESRYAWKNEDTFFPSFSQPNESYIQWATQYGHSYAGITVTAPEGVRFSGSASLNYIRNGVEVPVITQDITSESSFTLSPPSPSFETEWKITFSSLSTSVQEVTVTGIVTVLEPQASPSSRAILVMYPANLLPEGVYATLAQVDVSSDFKVIEIRDKRDIIHRDYTPIADWLTYPFDEDLIDMYLQVSNYSSEWMSPPLAMAQEYQELTDNLVEVQP